MILPGNAPESIASSAFCISAGGLLGLPTETVYGLAANADDDAAVARIFQAKGRPADHPLIVHVADASVVAHYASAVPEFAQQLMHAFWPGPLTLILPRRPGVANAAAGGNPTIGLRCPSHPVAQSLLTALRSLPEPVWGLAAPSANQFGRVSPTTAAHVQGEFGADLLILDGGACSVGIESSIIDCTRGLPVLLRPGVITPDQVRAVCGLMVQQKREHAALDTYAPKASGTLDSHYAPKARVTLLELAQLQQQLVLLGAQWQAPPFAGEQPPSPKVAVWSRFPWDASLRGVVWQQMPTDAADAAQQLFAVLREFDAQGVCDIWIEAVPETAQWAGVRDRLQRAAH